MTREFVEQSLRISSKSGFLHMTIICIYKEGDRKVYDFQAALFVYDRQVF